MTVPSLPLNTGARIPQLGLGTWPLDSLAEVIDRPDFGEEWRHPRGFVLERVHAHDLWHAAEASEILTAMGLPPIDPWG